LRINKRYLFVVAVISMLMLVAACSSTSDTDEVLKDSLPNVVLLVTRDYGSEEILKETVEFEKYWTVLDALDANSEIITEHGGSFISGINGFESYSEGASGKRMDWFYYINGICADVGPLDYDLNEGDVVWWDYHEWKSMDSTNSTVIGSYPEPFVHGYRGEVAETTIMCSVKNSDLASELRESLMDKGAATVEISEIDNSIIEDRVGPVIVLGEWEELDGVEYINKFNEAYKRNGTYIYYTGEGLELMDNSNEKIMSLKDGSGSIMSHGDGLGDENPLWIISGVDSTGLEKAIKLLTENSDKIYSTYSVAVGDNEVIKLPINN
jgi:hypothetical protein